MLLGMMLIDLSIQVTLIVCLCRLLLLTLFLALNEEFLRLISDKEFPNIQLLSVSTKLRAIGLVKSVSCCRCEDIMTTARLNWCFIELSYIFSRAYKSLQSVGGGRSCQI